MKETLVGKTQEEIIEYLEKMNEPKFKGKQLSSWIYEKHARDFSEVSNLSKKLKAELEENSQISPNKVVHKSESSDNTKKYLIKLADGNTVEAVNIHQEKYHTACISTQVGCNVGCPFCATGLSGFKKNLSPGDIVDQYLLMQKDSEKYIKQIVFMGMGEPFLNYNSTMKAVHLLNNEIGVGMRHITISTSGVINKIEKLMQEKMQLNLAISLHAADNEKRNFLVPLNKTNPLTELLQACKKYAEYTKRRITFEYVMLDGVNDTERDVKLLLNRLKGIHCHINLIPHNTIYSEKFKATPMNKIKQFRDALKEKGFPVTIRVSRGSDINSACGQLREIKGE